MKKNFFMLAATAALFAACAETELVNEVNVEGTQQEIGFSTFANKVTRAENSTESTVNGLEGHHADFDVWAYKNTMNPGYVFKDVVVSYQSASDKWQYEGLKYWDKAANTYYFYAAAPSRVDWILNQNDAAKQEDDYFTFANFVLENRTLTSTSYVQSLKDATNQDLMIASPEKVEEAAILSAATVQLDFNHILSRLNITVAKSATLADEAVALTSISVNNLPNAGSFDESLADVNQNATVARWTLTGDKGYITGNKLAAVSTTSAYVIQSLVIPQNVAYQAIDRDGTNNKTTVAPYLYIEYTIGGEPFNASYNLANAFGSTANPVAFNEGWQNTLNITLDAATIVFDAVTFEWEDYKEFDKTFGNETF